MGVCVLCACACIRVHAYVCVHTCACACVHACDCVSVCVTVTMCMCVCVCVYMHTCVYVPRNLRICAIPRLCCTFSESRTIVVQSFTPTRMCRNHLVVAREATKKNGDFVSVLQNSRVQAMIVWLSLVENKPALLRTWSGDLLVKSE